MSEINQFDCPLECGARIISLNDHLKKCKMKKKIGYDYLICPHNSNHIIKINLLQLHIINCEDKPISNNNDTSDDDDLDNKISDDDNKEKNEIIENKENINVNNNLTLREGNIKFNLKIKKYNKPIKSYLYENEKDIDSYSLDFFNKVYSNFDKDILKQYI